MAEIVADWDVRIPPSFAMVVFPRMQPREFSICSFLEGVASICVGVIRYKTILTVPRTGVCTQYLSKLIAGDAVRVKIKAGTFQVPQDSTPLILIGPGLGIAPLRSIWQQELGKRPMYIFAGCRYRDGDSLYVEEILALPNSCKHWLACSRDGPQKVYVQDLMMQQSNLLADLIFDQNATVILCGNAKRMPDDVQATLIKILATRKDNASEYF